MDVHMKGWRLERMTCSDSLINFHLEKTHVLLKDLYYFFCLIWFFSLHSWTGSKHPCRISNFKISVSPPQMNHPRLKTKILTLSFNLAKNFFLQRKQIQVWRLNRGTFKDESGENSHLLSQVRVPHHPKSSCRRRSLTVLVLIVAVYTKLKANAGLHPRIEGLQTSNRQ